MSLRFHTSGNARHWQFRQSDHRSDALRRHHHGPLLPMQHAPTGRSLIAIWLGAVALGLIVAATLFSTVM